MSILVKYRIMPIKDPEARRAYHRRWVAKRRADFFQDKACVECSSTNELELDHIDPSQKVEHRIWSWTQARRDAEIAKCQVLCKKHHHDKSKRNGDYGTSPGTPKLNLDQVKEIRHRHRTTKVTHAQLAKDFGVGRSTITECLSGKSWQHGGIV